MNESEKAQMRRAAHNRIEELRKNMTEAHPELTDDQKVLYDWLEGSVRQVAREREDWVVACLERANIPVDELNSILRWRGRAEGFQGETLEKFYQDQINEFFRKYKIQIIIMPERPEVEFFVVGGVYENNHFSGGEVIGAWNNQVGLTMQEDSVKLNLTSWVKEEKGETK